jgi:hypothetical protein
MRAVQMAQRSCAGVCMINHLRVYVHNACTLQTVHHAVVRPGLQVQQAMIREPEPVQSHAIIRARFFFILGKSKKSEHGAW